MPDDGLKESLRKPGAGFSVEAAHGDPASDNPTENAEESWLSIMTTKTGILWLPAPGQNNLTMRLEVVDGVLTNTIAPGVPVMVLSPVFEQ